jgi:hypothetical protein
VANADVYSTQFATFVQTFAQVMGLPPLERYFFIEGGALAVENALKAAMDWKVRQNLAAGRVPNPLPLRRLVTELLERGSASEELWADPAEAPPYALHQFRVAQISLLVGRVLSLTQGVLQDLGVAAYHDCGYAAEPRPRTWRSPSSGTEPWARLSASAASTGQDAPGARVLRHHRDANDTCPFSSGASCASPGLRPLAHTAGSRPRWRSPSCSSGRR